ncbi:hypothetical protein [Coxiella burnetii]|nr:hypothetical protein [Coxiella burnetii]ACJ17843.1 hypothetical protein CbuG_0415 [Coxiella burnetii CbuG_Q212]ATN66277.1 hypothetical protein AYM17_01950 [Coxiella burnetii]OYK86797.1 hypothetical protein CbuQ229_02075 [Coxiella burnetii]
MQRQLKLKEILARILCEEIEQEKRSVYNPTMLAGCD